MDLFEYLDTYGEYTFEQKEFNEIDNLIFSQLSYTYFEGIIGYEDSKPLDEVAISFYDKYSENEIGEFIGITAKSAELLKKCAISKRFGKIQICHYINNVNDEIDKQFSGVSFVLGNGDLVIAYRGTDITVTGVKESAMLSFLFPVPAQIEALYYFQETAMRYDKGIYVCGHSKGGNLAVFAAVNCSNSLKKRLKAVYEDDAPGFPRHFFERYDYRQIKDKIHHIVPQCSVFGRLLFHDITPKIVRSTNKGLKQHQVSSWVINNDELEIVENFDTLSDFYADYLKNLLDYISDDDLEIFFDMLEHIATSLGVENFYDTKELDFKDIFTAIDSVTTVEDDKKQHFKLVLKTASADFAKYYITNKKNEYVEMLSNLKFKLELPDKEEIEEYKVKKKIEKEEKKQLKQQKELEKQEKKEIEKQEKEQEKLEKKQAKAEKKKQKKALAEAEEDIEE